MYVEILSKLLQNRSKRNPKRCPWTNHAATNVRRVYLCSSIIAHHISLSQAQRRRGQGRNLGAGLLMKAW